MNDHCDCILHTWDRHEPELRRWLRGKLPDQAVAEDLLQDVFLRVIQQGEQFCEVKNPRAWLFTVARRRLIDQLRVHRDTIPIPDSLPQPEDESPPVESLAACLPRALRELDPRDAEILQWCDLEGQTQAAFAAEHDLSVPGAKSRLQRARRRLKRHLMAACRVQFGHGGEVCCFVPR